LQLWSMGWTLNHGRVLRPSTQHPPAGVAGGMLLAYLTPCQHHCNAIGIVV
jgi:hypothetical protein